MSKCDIIVKFEDDTRIFHGGDKIRGVVHIRVNQDVTCRGIYLRGRWKTTGRGNQSSKKYFDSKLHSGELKAGDYYKFPFELQAPHKPLTYRGHYLNIDHYLEARVDLPWAFDPKYDIDFVVLPGASKPVEVGVTQPFANRNQMGATAGLIVAGIMAGTGVLLLPAFGFGLIFIVIAAFVLFFSMRSKLAEKKIGEVAFDIGEPITTAGRRLPIDVSFTPNGNGQINRVNATLTAEEICVSGSGSNRRTHRHRILRESLSLEGPSSIKRGTRTSYTGQFEIPQTRAYSFEGGSNRVVWSVATHVDIPRWPDWKQVKTFTVVPPEHLSEPPVRSQADTDESIIYAEPLQAEAIDASHQEEKPLRAETWTFDDEPIAIVAADEQDDSFAESSEATQAVIEPSKEVEQLETLDSIEDEKEADLSPPEREEQESQPVVETPPNFENGDALEEEALEEIVVGEAEDSLPPSPALAAICEELQSARRFSDEADEIIERHADQQFATELIVERTTSTIGCYDEPEFRNGRTVIGKLIGSDQPISIQMPDSENENVRELRSGDRLSATIRVSGWDDLYKRVEARSTA